MIFFFSGTGNTRWAARRLGEATGERLVDMAKDDAATDYVLGDGERIGFCFPVHGWKPPKVVRRFIKRLRIEGAEGHYCFALCTCGDSVGKATDILNNDLAHIGLRAESVFSLIMPETYVTLPFMLTDTPEKEKRKLRTAVRMIGSICESVVRRERGLRELVTGPMPWVLSHVIGTVFNSVLITDSHFRVDGDKCSRCGACAKACPTGDVSCDRGQVPTWHHDGRCTACLSCYHHCPQHAISYGPLTHRRGQYYFKDSKVEGME